MKTAAVLLVTACWCFGQSSGHDAPEKIRIERHLATPMRDGVKLYGDLYRPARDGKFPVLVVRTPYGVQRDGTHQTMIKLAQHGYAAPSPPRTWEPSRLQTPPTFW